MLNKLFTFILLIISLSSTAQTGEYVTIRDFGIWSGANFQYKPGNKWTLGIEQQVRFRDDASIVDQYFTEFSVKKLFENSFYIGIGTRFIQDHDTKGDVQGYDPFFRLNADFGYKHKIDRFSLKYQLRYQTKNELGVSESEGDIASEKYRLKVSAEYNIKKWKLDPKLSSEIFNNTDSESSFDKIRVTLGTKYKTKNIGDFTLFYRMQKELNVENPLTFNILGLQYSYTLKKK